VHVIGVSEVKAIAAGADQSLALLNNGTVVAWGGNESGELGDGTTVESEAPIAVKGLAGVTAIAAGGKHGLALLSYGQVMAWGADEFGELGNSSVVRRAGRREEERFSELPVAVEGISNASAITAGGRHSLALLGTVVAWGADGAGQLGDGSITASAEAPVPVSGLSGVAQVCGTGPNDQRGEPFERAVVGGHEGDDHGLRLRTGRRHDRLQVRLQEGKQCRMRGEHELHGDNAEGCRHSDGDRLGTQAQERRQPTRGHVHLRIGCGRHRRAIRSKSS
jgi:hypothetical protein